MTKLRALLGILAGAKSAEDTVHHLLQKSQLFNGFTTKILAQ